MHYFLSLVGYKKHHPPKKKKKKGDNIRQYSSYDWGTIMLNVFKASD
jgi:hypothetical protein